MAHHRDINPIHLQSSHTIRRVAPMEQLPTVTTYSLVQRNGIHQQDTTIHLCGNEPTFIDAAFRIDSLWRDPPTTVRAIFLTLFSTALLFFAMRLATLHVVVEGISMDPTLGDNQHLHVNRLAYWHFDRKCVSSRIPNVSIKGDHSFYLFGKPRLGDIVVTGTTARRSTLLIKRLIGLPGEMIYIHDSVVYINDVPIDEPYIAAPPAYTYPASGQPYTLKENEYFVLGDNRNISSDSHLFGPVKKDTIIGKACFSIWPWRHIGSLSRHTS